MTDRRARRHEETRREILEAAWGLAREQGLTGWSLREVGAIVGMRAPSLYGYFDGKNAIYDAMFAEGYAALLAEIEALADEPAAAAPDATPNAAPDGDAPRRLARMAHLFFDFSVGDPARFQLLFLRVVPGFTPSPESYALAEETLDRARESLAEVGVTDDRAVDLWTALTTGLASQQIANEPGGARWGRLIDDAVRMFLSLAADRTTA